MVRFKRFLVCPASSVTACIHAAQKLALVAKSGILGLCIVLSLCHRHQC